MYEHRTHPVLPPRQFAKRVAGHVTIAFALVVFALGIGVLGYHYFSDLPWLDALLNASMILSGMGPVDRLATPGAKLFASFYALFSGLAFIAVASMLVAPFVHRVFHKLHVQDK